MITLSLQATQPTVCDFCVVLLGLPVWLDLKRALTALSYRNPSHDTRALRSSEGF